MEHAYKISIVTPNYNGGAYLEETILSVLEQGYPNLEYIVIDGGSTDNSVEIIRKYEKYLAYWVSEKDNGMYDAIQKGFEKSTGDIMAWLNSDDMYHRKALFAVNKLFQALPEVEWIQGLATKYNLQGDIIYTHLPRRWSKYDYFVRTEKDKWIQQESTFWRRSLWEKAGSYVDRRLQLAGDFELWMRFFEHAYLYSALVLVGGFRYRGAADGQKSQKFYSEYLQEVDQVLQEKLARLPQAVRKRIREIEQTRKYHAFTQRLRLNFTSLKQKLLELYDYPPIIFYDFASQRFSYWKNIDLYGFYPYHISPSLFF